MVQKCATIKRLLKAAVIIICVSGFLFQTAQFFFMYTTFPTVVDIQVSVPSEIDIPGFTFCSSIGLYPKSVCDLKGFCSHPKMFVFLKICKIYPEVCINGKPPDGFRAVAYSSFFKKFDLNTTTLELMRIPLSEFLKCKIVSGGHERKCNTESAIYASYYSDSFSPNFCYSLYTLWSQPEKKREKIKKSEKIEMEFYIDLSHGNKDAPIDEIQYPIYNSLSTSSVQMAIHSPYISVSPFIAGTGFLAGKMFRVKLKQDEKHLLPPPYQTNCTDYMPAWRARGGIGPLNQLMVIQECKFNESRKVFGCVPYMVDYPHNETLCKYCENCPNITRLGDNCTDLLQHYNQPCDFINYIMEVEEKLVNIEKEFKSALVKDSETMIFREKGYNCTHTNIYSRRCQIVQIEITFDEFEITNVTYNPKFESLELFSVIGGYMGMYLGVSLVAVYDFGEMILMAIYRLMKKRRSIKKKLKSRKEKDAWSQNTDGYRYPKSFRKRVVRPFSSRDIY